MLHTSQVKTSWLYIFSVGHSPLNLEKRPTAKNAVVYENYDGKNMRSCIRLRKAKLDWLIGKTSVCIAT